MSVEANIGYGLRIRGTAESDIRHRVGELVDLVRLNGLEHKRPKELSGGQRQRVALARAIAVRPKVLLLDEPLTALDAKLKESLRDELADLLRRLSITAIHVTHDQQEAMAIADRLAVMQAGRVVQVGSAEDLYRSPHHTFVATFLGRVNRLPLTRNAQGQAGVMLGGCWMNAPAGALTASEVLVRPEDVRLDPHPQGPHATSPVQVSHRTFLGDHIRLQLTTTEGVSLLVDASRDCAFQVGDAVTLSIDPAALMACDPAS
jgi:putative spermidine/putrescine transport system ATP-binding protein